MHFIYFLGRFHVLALHLPITLILVVALLEGLNHGQRRPELQPALDVLWPATALAALLTMVLGYMHFSEGGFSGVSALAHRALGTGVALIATFGWWLRSSRRAWFNHTRAALVTLLVVLVTVTGHFGGNLTHGDTYLVDYAPNFVRRAIGLEPQRAAVTRVADADAYADVVAPIFQSRCVECHNANKLKGGLNLTSYDNALKGGKDGVVIVPGKADASDMVRRISLAPNEDDFMPNGKTALTADQVSLIRWWIETGAKRGVKVGAMKAPAAIQALIATGLHLGGASATLVASAPESEAGAMPEVEGPEKKVDPKILDALVAQGFMGRQVSLSSTALIVSPVAPGAAISAAQIRALTAVAPGQIAELDLRNAGLGDAAIAPIGQLTALRRLRLDHNHLTDVSVSALAGLRQLESLSLYGNSGVTDKSVAALSQVPSLRQLYLWDTGISAAGLSKLRQAKPHLQIDDGDALSVGQPSTLHAPASQAAP